DRRRRNQWAALVAGLAAFALVGGLVGVVLGAGVVVLGPVVLARLEPRAARHRRQVLEASAPMVADLLAACLVSGASTGTSVMAVAQALGEPVESVLVNCVAQIQLGADPARVWGALAEETELAPIARSILRSADSGAPLADLLLRTGDDLRSARRARLEAMARSAGIKAVGPLGVCFLPAFMLLGVVPLVASLIGDMLARS
ncbi:MAG: type II secretion system F family protein, partial [Actinomycetes bacterium]